MGVVHGSVPGDNSSSHRTLVGVGRKRSMSWTLCWLAP